MLTISKVLDTKSRDGSDTIAEPPQSPATVNSSAPASPAASLFSSRGHNRLSSSVSSLASLSGLGSSMEGSKSQLTEVREEDSAACEEKDLKDDYFEHCNQGMRVSDDASYFAFVEYPDEYDLTDASMDVSRPSKKQSQDNPSSVKGLSRIGSRISTMSSRWRSKRNSDGTTGDESFSGERSRANSTSSTKVNPTINSLTRIDAHLPPSPAHTLFEERLSEPEVGPIGIVASNNQLVADRAPKATTPLLPPFMRKGPSSSTLSIVHSPLQSPSVAGVLMVDDEDDVAHGPLMAAGIPSPPLSAKPSVASFSRQPATALRSFSGAPPLILTDPNDEWAHKLGHANFSIQPGPYTPEVCDRETFEQLREDWDTARCNFAKHLVRTGEHYGVTSNIYRLTEAKWESINREWKQIYNMVLTQLEASRAITPSLTQVNHQSLEQLKLPGLFDRAKFPELGDGEIVGPMSVAPGELCRHRSRKRNFLKFFQDLVTKS